jgi:hypothetical protein
VDKRRTTAGEPTRGEGAPRPGSSASSDHWKRLLRRPARASVPIDAVAFVAELNRRLRADPAWREDTRFVVAADADGRIAGSTWEGPESMKAVVARVVKSAVGEYEIEQPFLFDR